MEFGIIEVLKEIRADKLPKAINGIIEIGQNDNCKDLGLIANGLECVNTFTPSDIDNLSQERREIFLNSCAKLAKRFSKIIGDKINELKENKPKEKSFDEMTKEELIAYIKNKH